MKGWDCHALPLVGLAMTNLKVSAVFKGGHYRKCYVRALHIGHCGTEANGTSQDKVDNISTLAYLRKHMRDAVKES
jgi:hypothetical protein